MWMKPGHAGGLVLALVLALGGCGDRTTEDQTAPAAEAAQMTPEQQMQSALQRVVDAQASYFRDHNRYSDSLGVLVDDYGFQPVGEAQVALQFAERETEPQWGYVATAVHPFSNQRCEVLHGRTTDGREFAGQIVCEGPAEGPPMPAQAPPAGTDMRAAPEPQPVAPGAGPDAQRVTPRTEIDTTHPAERRP
jgi:hypothetical protein